MLLHWCTIEPTGPADLAAIRFSQPVRVQSIKIFPSDTKPFAHHPDVISRTEPQEFFLNVFFNAYPVSKEKAKPSNALVPTTIAYTGGQSDFVVNMGAEYATRLMIVKGSYECVSMAIYGDIMAEISTEPSTYKPRLLPSVEPAPLSKALDPSNSLDPTHLARQLLNTIPDAPPLPLVIRLMFCLKPSDEDWDSPDFPFLHPNLEEAAADFDLEKAFTLTSTPAADDTPREVLREFAQKVADSVKDKDSNQAYLLAGILSQSACQHPDLAKSLLETLDLNKSFDTSTVDDSGVLKLLTNAVTNPDITSHLNSEWFVDMIRSISKDQSMSHETHLAAKKLLVRIQGWDVLQDAFTNTQGDFIGAACFMTDIGTDEQSFGIWLESLVTHEDIIARIAEIPTLPIALPNPPLLLGTPKSSISHDEFIAFLRAFIGVSCVLAVYAWADALPHQRCRERALSILRLWQGVDGYREIVNHLLHLRQMVYRLECMMETDDPSRAGVEAENILVNLSKDPRAFLDLNFIDCIFEMKQPLSFITEDERISLRQAAFVVDDGLPGAIKEILDPVELPLTLTSLRTLRVALAVVERELEEQGEWQVFQDFWEKGNCSLVTRLAEVFMDVTEEIADHFSLALPSAKSQELIAQSFCTADELLRLLLRLVHVYPIPTRLMREVTTGVADLFVCIDSAAMLYSQSSAPYVAAQVSQQSCIDIVRMLSDPTAHVEGGKLGADVILRTLLQHGLQSQNHDPAHHLLQVFRLLIDYVVPASDTDETLQAVWTQRVIPMLLQDLWAFCRVLDTENKVHFVRQLSSLDRGVVGIGDWLSLEELKELARALRSLEDPTLSLNQRAVHQYQATLSLRFFADLADVASDASQWCVQCMTAVPEAAHILATCFMSLLDQHIQSPHLTRLAQDLAAVPPTDDHDLSFALVAVLLRSAHSTTTDVGPLFTLLDLSMSILSATIPDTIVADRLRLELGTLMLRCGEGALPLNVEVAELLVSLMQWFAAAATSDVPLLAVPCGLSESAYAQHCERLIGVLPEDCGDRIKSVQGKLSLEEEQPAPIPPVSLPDSLVLTLHEAEDLLRSHIPPPSTPQRNALNQDVLGLVTISPPALFRSPAAIGLTKTYSNNDFRQLRQTPSARQNTSRLPSMHVDDFESASSPTLVSVPMPFAGPERLPPLAPPFNPL